MAERDLAGKPGPSPRDNAQNLEFDGARGIQKGSPANRPGIPLLVAAQYIQKTLKNNGLFRNWGMIPKSGTGPPRD
jgi:hypothetical protein